MKSIKTLIEHAKFTIALTGAGVSTFSGLPDFRGKTGLYQNAEYVNIFDLRRFLKDPKFYYCMTKELLYSEKDLRASIIHQALYNLEKKGLLKAIITQNIGRLHQAAGSQKVVEVHGSGDYHHCLSCGSEFTWKEISARLQTGEMPPICKCGGIIKPDITFFGENLPQEAFHQAKELLQVCDLLLILGTSLTVEPVASLPRIALKNGAKIVIVNDASTWIDPYASIKLTDLEEFVHYLL